MDLNFKFQEIVRAKENKTVIAEEKVEETRGRGKKKKKPSREEIVEPSFISKFFKSYGYTLVGLVVVVLAMFGVYFCALD